MREDEKHRSRAPQWLLELAAQVPPTRQQEFLMVIGKKLRTRLDPGPARELLSEVERALSH